MSGTVALEKGRIDLTQAAKEAGLVIKAKETHYN